jgi:hypothetical protein
MIQLHSDCLVFEVSGGDKIPCSVEKLTIEVLSDSLEQIDPDVIREAARAVLHYFKDDLGRDTVTIDEFTSALEHVLVGLGYEIEGATATATPIAAKPTGRRIVGADLAAMASSLGDSLELDFYPRLRRELRSLLAGTPQLVHFRGLRPCAKRLARVRRWCPRSIQVSEEIVRFLRDCWGAERPRQECALMVK